MGWLPTGGGAGTDTDAIHDNVAAEIDALSAVTPVAGDWAVIEDTSDSDNKKKVDVTHFLGGSSPTATNYTPVIVASGTAWAAGNATQFGNYLEWGDLVFLAARIKLGSTTTHGTGTYTTTLPVAADTSGGELRFQGVGVANDAGTKLWSVGCIIAADGTSMSLYYDDGLGALVNLGATAPFTFTTNDVITFTLVYQKTAVT